MSGRPPRSQPLAPPPHEALLRLMGALPMSDDAVAAIKAVMVGQASQGQQIRAMDLIVNEIAGAGRNPFCGENPQGTAFRAGAQAVGQALLLIKQARVTQRPHGGGEHDR